MGRSSSPLRQFALFAGVGAFSTALHYAVLVAGVSALHWPAVQAASLGYAAGALTGYLLNYTLTFGSVAAHATAAPRYAVMVLCGAVLNAGLVWLGLLGGLHYLLAQAGATVVVTLVNFCASRAWAFKENEG